MTYHYEISIPKSVGMSLISRKSYYISVTTFWYEELTESDSCGFKNHRFNSVLIEQHAVFNRGQVWILKYCCFFPSVNLVTCDTDIDSSSAGLWWVQHCSVCPAVSWLISSLAYGNK